MGRSMLAVVAGAVLWAVLWLGSNSALAAMFPEIVVADQYLGHVGMLLTFLALSVVFSVLAGLATGLIDRGRAVRHGIALGVLQLALGIGFEMSYWPLLPVWYHLTFLALLLPANVSGAWLVRA